MSKIIAAAILLTVSLPIAGALAQNSTNNVNHAAGAEGSKVATPDRPTAGPNPALTTGTISKQDEPKVPVDKNPNAGGATGHTVVQGNPSTVAGQKERETFEKTGK
jgi:hypothetical protein